MGKDTDGEEVFPNLNSDEEIIIFGTTSTEDIPMKEIVEHTSFSSAQKGYHIRSDLEDRGYLEKKGWGEYGMGGELIGELCLTDTLDKVASEFFEDEVLVQEQKGESRRYSDFPSFERGDFRGGQEKKVPGDIDQSVGYRGF